MRTETSNQFYTVQKGVPITPLANGTGRPSKLRSVMAELQIGDSFLIPVKSRSDCHHSNIWRMAKLLGVKIATRAEGDNTRRVWCVSRVPVVMKEAA